MSIDVDLQVVNDALLDQVRELSGRLARVTAAVKAQQQQIDALVLENRQQLDTIVQLHEQLAELQQPSGPG